MRLTEGRIRSGWIRRIGSHLGVLALLVQCVVAATHFPALALSPFADPAAWCISGDVPGGHDLPGNSGSHKLPPCPICQSMQSVGMGLPPATPVAIPVGFTIYLPPFAETDTLPASRPEYLPANPRAPPTTI